MFTLGLRLLFPDLPETEGPIIVVSEELSRNSDDESDSDTEDELYVTLFPISCFIETISTKPRHLCLCSW